MKLNNENIVLYKLLDSWKLQPGLDEKELFHVAWKSIEDIVSKFKDGKELSKYEIDKACIIISKITIQECIEAMHKLTELITSGNYEAEWAHYTLASQLWHRAYKEGMFPKEAELVKKMETKFRPKEKKND